MKFFKKIAISCLALMMCLGMATLVACGGDKGGNSSESASSESVSSEISSEISSETSSEISSESVSSEVSSAEVSSESTSAETSSEVVSGENSSESSENSSEIVAQANAYNFKVFKADGSPAVGYQVQMCTTDGSGICYMPVDIDANGFAAITTGPACPAPSVYEVHVLGYNESYGTYEPVELTETIYTPATFSTEFITIIFAD